MRSGDTAPQLFLLALAGGATVANIYYAQPLLGAIAQELKVSSAAAGRVPVATQLGYGLGMLVLVPLGDRVDRQRLIVSLMALSSLSLIVVTLVGRILGLLATFLALGFTSSAPQIMVPYAATAARPGERGRSVGIVTSGLLAGVVVARIMGGVVGAELGWRAVYLLAAGIMLALALLVALRLPAQRPESPVRLGELYVSLGRVLRDQPALRLHALLGAVTYGSLSVLWVTLAFHLAAHPAHYGSAAVGAFGLAGIAGALAAPAVGRLADRFDPRVLNGFAVALTAASFGELAAFGRGLVGVGVGAALLEVGARSNHVANQTRVLGLDPALRSRLNTVYMTAYFVGGALGSWLGSAAWARAGWGGVCASGAALCAVGLAALARDFHRNRPRRLPSERPDRPRTRETHANARGAVCGPMQ